MKIPSSWGRIIIDKAREILSEEKEYKIRHEITELTVSVKSTLFKIRLDELRLFYQIRELEKIRSQLGINFK